MHEEVIISGFGGQGTLFAGQLLTYTGMDEVMAYIEMKREEIQCLVAENLPVPGAVKPGQTQHPGLSDFADNLDTMEFLMGI